MSEVKTYQILTNLNCNLDCTYCYENKCDKVNTIEDITQYLHALFTRDKGLVDSVNIELIGGESLLYVDLVEAIIKVGLGFEKLFDIKVNFSLCTNGTLLTTPKVSSMLLRYQGRIGIGLSIDGTKAIHNKHRIYKASRKGSYDDVVTGIEWLKSNWCTKRWGVKATFTQETMPQYTEGIKNIYALGCKDIAANIVFEDVADYMVCLNQFKEVADFLLTHSDCKVHQFNSDSVMAAGRVFKREPHNFCGTTKYMTCLGFDGYIYGCNRFCTMDRPNMAIGMLTKGGVQWYDTPFMQEVIGQYLILPTSCQKCDVAGICPMCAAAPYDEDISIVDYYSEKRMCGWTYALTAVHQYMKNKGYHKELDFI